MIDRIEPTRRPASRIAGYQQWRSLLFLHWEVPVRLLRPLVPEQLELDLYQETAFVGVVPFAMQEVRPFWWPPPLAFHFLETNVRTYVVYRDKPGVYFFSLDANSLPAVCAARLGWGLPYFHARMTMSRTGGDIHYRVQRKCNGATHDVRYAAGNELGNAVPGSLEHFLVERYLLFTEKRGRMLTGQVHHTPYPLCEAHVDTVHDELMTSAGLPPTAAPPALAHYSPGVDVEVFGPN